MGKGGWFEQSEITDRELTWQEIRSHASRTDKWIVIDGCVYDITKWAKRHPGGERIISNYAGQDASDAWFAFHNDKKMVSRYMKPLLIGRLAKSEDGGTVINDTETPLEKDFRDLRRKAEDLGYFKTSVSFFVIIMLHLFAFEAAGWIILYFCGTGWVPYIIAAVLLATSQAQAGWSQHDYGHLSVFKSTKLNHWTQMFILNVFKGASSAWWNYRHYNHHAKPNIIKKDPDIRLEYLFLIGKVIPKEWGKKKKGHLPFQYQHNYFYFILPPLLLPLYFNFEILYFMIKRKLWQELSWTTVFFLRWQLMFSPILGVWGTFGLFLFVRFIESHWFVWATQMSHIPMEVDYDKRDDWVTMQLKATCNVEQSFFNDWFSGHLNFQIEHHLFPTMPRHNYHKVAPLVQSLCKKHGLEYQNKPLFTAFADIVGSLKASGKLWYDAYYL